MATRLEKIFRSKTIETMNGILNEVNEIVESQTNKRPNTKEWIAVSKRISKSICGFYKEQSITDEQIRRACEGKK